MSGFKYEYKGARGLKSISKLVGISPNTIYHRMAHSDAKSTQIYTRNHIDWVHVPHAEIAV